MHTGLINLTGHSSVGITGFYSAPSQTEQAVQAAGYLGYLDLLLSNTNTPASGVIEVVDKLNQLKNSVNDPTVLPLITAGLAAYSTSASAYRNWWVMPIDPQGTTNGSALMTWLSSSTVTRNFSPSDANSNTEFALLMLLCDSQSYTAGQMGLSSAVDGFFGQTMLSGNAPELLAQFITAYLGSSASAATLASILPKDSAKSMPNYDAFVTALSSSSIPSFNDQAGITTYWFTPVASRFFTNLF